MMTRKKSPNIRLEPISGSRIRLPEKVQVNVRKQMKKKQHLVWSILLVVAIVGITTWSRARHSVENMIPHADALLEIERLCDSGAYAEADVLFTNRLAYLSIVLRQERTGGPFPSKRAVAMADRIDAYLANHEQAETKPEPTDAEGPPTVDPRS